MLSECQTIWISDEAPHLDLNCLHNYVLNGQSSNITTNSKKLNLKRSNFKGIIEIYRTKI